MPGSHPTRRAHLAQLGQWLQTGVAGLLPLPGRAVQAADAAHSPTPPPVRPDTVLRFPADHGAHPAYRTEWWYLTGTLQGSSPDAAFGFQLTFFRSRVDVAAHSASRFAVRQLVFAHAALTDLRQRQLRHDQRIGRTGFGLVEAAEGDTRLTLRDWTLARTGPVDHSVYQGHIAARDYTLDLRATQTQALLLQGQAGYSRKGPRPEQASHYYTQPHLAVTGTLQYAGRTQPVQGQAWLDHEWSEALLDADAVGWDWIGMNLADGSALTAFRLRRRDGRALWAGGSLRRPGQPVQTFGPDAVRFTPGRTWRSPATATLYPVEWAIEVPSGRYTVRARLDNQELDSRASTGSIYWEGLSTLFDAQGRAVGQGYLEMTGYAGKLAL